MNVSENVYLYFLNCPRSLSERANKRTALLTRMRCMLASTTWWAHATTLNCSQTSSSSSRKYCGWCTFEMFSPSKYALQRQAKRSTRNTTVTAKREHSFDRLKIEYTVLIGHGSVPARPISEGAVPCPYWLAPCPIYTRAARIKKKKN